MKKLFTLLLCGLFLCNMPMNVNAQEPTCVNCVSGIGDEYIDPNWPSVANNNFDSAISPYATGVNLYITNYYQDDYKDIMQSCGQSIQKSGCALTAFTMASNFLTSANRTPATVNGALKSNACPLVWSEAGKTYGLTVRLRKTSGLTASYVTSELVAQLNNNVPVIVGMQYTNGGTHFVLVKGYSETAGKYTFNINDPYRGYNKKTLAEYQNMGVKFTELVVYSN